MKKSMKTRVLGSVKFGLLFFCMSSLILGQTFTPTGGTEVSDRWNASNTSGVFNFNIPNNSSIISAQINLFSNGSPTGGNTTQFNIERPNVDTTLSYSAGTLEGLTGFNNGSGNTLQFKVLFKDLGGIPVGDLLEIGPTFQFDETAPADLSPDSVVTTGSVKKAGYWNSTSTGIKVYTDIDGDASLEDGTIQILGYFGATATIDDTISTPVALNIYPNDDQVVTVSNTRIESISGFGDGEELKIASIITDYAGNATIVSASSSTLTIDETAPTIDEFTSTPVAGTLGIDSTATITIKFDEPVTLVGQIDIDLAGVPTDVTIGNFSNDDTPSGTYTVAQGDSVGDLDVDSVEIAFGTLRDLAGNTANVSRLGSTPLASNSNLRIDGVAPLIKSFSSSQATGTLGIGDQITITINFTDDVELAGGGSLKLYLNGVSNPIDVSNPNGNSVGVNYSVSETDQSTDLSVDSLSLTGSATLKDDGGNNVTNRLTLTGATNLDAANGGDELVIDGVYPNSFQVGAVIAEGGTVSTHADYGYWNSTNTQMKVTVPVDSDLSTVGGSIQVKGYIGGVPRSVGSSTSITTDEFNYQVTIPRSDIELIPGYSENNFIKYYAIITDAAGNALDGSASVDSFYIDETLPIVSSITSLPNDSLLGVGGTADITVHFSETVTLADGKMVVDYVDISANDSVTAINGDSKSFEFQAVANDYSTDLDIEDLSLTSGASLRDAAGNPTNLDSITTNLAVNSALWVDGKNPTLSSITASTTPDTLGDGETLNFTLNFSEWVFLNDDNLEVIFEGTSNNGIVVPFEGTSASGTLLIGTNDASLDLSVDHLELVGSATLVDSASNNATNLASMAGVSNLDANAAIIVDGVAPAAFTVADVTVSGANESEGYYNSTSNLVTVKVPIANDVSLGGGRVYIQGYFASPAGLDTLGSSIAISSGDVGDSVIVNLSDTDIEAHGGFGDNKFLHLAAIIKDRAGNSTTGTASADTFKVDTTAASISSITYSENGNDLGEGDSTYVTLTFSEKVWLSDGDLRTTLETGSTVSDAVLTTTAFGDTNRVRENYIVAEGHLTNSLAARLVATTGDLRDIAGNDARLTPLPAQSSNIQVDGVFPVISRIIATTATDTLGVGESAEITIEMSKKVTLSGDSLRVYLNSAAGRYFAIGGISSDSLLAGNYVVKALDATLSLTVDSVVVVGANTLNDAFGNNSVLTLPDGQNLANNAAIIADGIIPADFTMGAITISGTNPTSGYWNGSDTLMNVAFDVADDQSLVGGRIYVQGYFASISGRQTLGSSYTIGSGDIGDAVIIPLNQSEVESHTSFDDGKVYHITALIKDFAGNEKLSSAASADTFYVDREIPEIESVTSINSDGNYGINDNVHVRLNFSKPVNMSGATLYTYLNTSSARVLDTNSIDESDTLSFNFLVAAEDNAVPLIVDSVTTTSDAVYDLAGNLADLSVPPGANLSTRSINLYGDNPVILNITTTSTSDAYYKIGDIIDVIVTFEESVHLDEDSLLMTLETGTIDRVVGIPASSINNTSQLTFYYQILAGDSVDVLSVKQIDESGLGTGAGALANIVGNPVDLSLPTAGTNLSDFSLHIDGVVPDTVDTGDIVVVGDPVVSGYYNATTDSIRATLPISAFDGSLIGGSARLQGRVDENPFVNIGSPVSILTADPITITLSAAQVEGLSNFEIGDSIQIRGVLTDMPGNVTRGNTSSTTLQIDQIYPDAITDGSYGAAGGIVYNSARWNATNLQYNVTSVIPNDSSLIGGTYALRSKIGAGGSFAASGFDSIMVLENINAPLAMALSPADLNTLGISDGDTVRFSPALTDRAGNTTESGALFSLYVDYTAPALFDLDTMLATGGLVKANYFNSNNDGIDVTITLDDSDPTLIGGELQLRAGVNTPENVMAPIVIANFNEITISVPRDTLEGLTDWGSVQTLEFDAIVTDIAGNTRISNAGLPVTVVDEILPASYTTDEVNVTGGSTVDGYWNNTSTGIDISIPLDDTDLTLLDGEVYCQGRVLPFPFETFPEGDTLDTVDPLHVISISSNDIEALTNFSSGKFMEFQAYVIDQAGNYVYYAPSLSIVEIDTTAPRLFTAALDTVFGENLPENTWNANSDSLRLNLSIPNDSTMVNGQADVRMQIGLTGTPEIVLVNIPIFTVNTDTSLIISSSDIQNLSDYLTSDGEYLYTSVAFTDRAGNQAVSDLITDSLFMDIAGPASAPVDTVIAYSGNVVEDAFNSTNEGIVIHVPIANDPTLSSGFILPRFNVGNGWIDLDTLVAITDLDTVQIVTLELASLDTLNGFGDNATLRTNVTLRDNAGNETGGVESSNQLYIDRTPPSEFDIVSLTTTGSPVIDGYWNSYNTGLDITVPIDNTDASLFGGQVYSWIYLSTWPVNNFEVIGDTTSITALTNRNLNYTAAEIEGIVAAPEDFEDGAFITMEIDIVDAYGNTRTSTRIDTVFVIDQTPPDTGHFIPSATYMDGFVNAEDTLAAAWDGFADPISNILRYEYSIGSSAGLADEVDWYDLDLNATMIDTFGTFVHADSFFINVRSLDSAGNISDTISTQGVVADLILPLNTLNLDPFYHIGEWKSDSSITGIATDELSGVDSVWVNIKRLSDSLWWNDITSDWQSDSITQFTFMESGSWRVTLPGDSLDNRIDYQVEVMATDNAYNFQNPTSVEIFQFVVNSPPEFLAIADTTIHEDSLYSFILPGTDPDLGTISGDTLFYSMLQQPDSAMIDSMSGLITWTPINADVGLDTLIVMVRDLLGESDTAQYVIEVLQVNDAPEPVTLLLPADSTQLIPSDSLLLTFTWTTAFDIENNPVTYRLSLEGAGYDTMLATGDTTITVDVSVMDFPSSTIEWFVRALDQADTSAIADTFHVTTSSAFAVLNTDSIAVNIERMTEIDTSFTMSNLGLTDLRWSLLDAPSWINLPIEADTIEYDSSAVIAFNISPSAFTVGGYGGQFRLVTNDPLQDTITVRVSVDIFDIPTPVIAFYKNRAYPSFYELMIVDSLGMIDSLDVTYSGLEVELTTVDTFSYVALVEVTQEGLNTFEVHASNWVGDTTITVSLTVSLIKRGSGWLARSPDEQFEMKGSSNSAVKSTRIAVLDSMLSAHDGASYKVLTDGVVLAEPVLVSMPALTNDQAIYLLGTAGDYVELASVSDGERVSAWTASMGAFKLGPRTIIVPEKSQLSQNYPNPFNPSTTIDFDIGFLDGLNQDIAFSIYNIRGQEVRNLMETQMQPGSYSITWNGLDDQGKQVSSGIYFARLMTGKGYVKTVKMLVLR